MTAEKQLIEKLSSALLRVLAKKCWCENSGLLEHDEDHCEGYHAILGARLAGAHPLAEIGRLVAEQDNRSTSEPMFIVRDTSRYGGEGRTVEAVCFTQAAADEYIRVNRHNLREPYVYVESGYNNPEWKRLREFLLTLAPGRVVQ